MTKYLLAFLALMFLPPWALAELVVSGKTSSRITGHVSKPNSLFVTNDQGGWFDQGLTLIQLGTMTSPYEAQARLRVTSSSGAFQMRLDTPLVIRNVSNPAQLFRTPKIEFGAESGPQQLVSVAQSIAFKNPVPIGNNDSVGYYTLRISAYAPEGDFKTTIGTYTGVLSLIFEPVVVGNY